MSSLVVHDTDQFSFVSTLNFGDPEVLCLALFRLPSIFQTYNCPLWPGCFNYPRDNYHCTVNNYYSSVNNFQYTVINYHFSINNYHYYSLANNHPHSSANNSRRRRDSRHCFRGYCGCGSHHSVMEKARAILAQGNAVLLFFSGRRARYSGRMSSSVCRYPTLVNLLYVNVLLV
ncbi:hypothetical protein X797_007034 [Metarhizium robertsii]|uniref:Uncharacterized protein n=1 Tax=Metarhizium robertsii TaxID=568076 RepID=A0A014N2M7_9HYPO|nr:hypothetical protein X797_007034 [Metarhizium robertsii]